MDKKITVQYYANTKLKAKSKTFNGKSEPVFPLYIRVIYDANNTQFKADLGDKPLYVTEDLRQLSTPRIKAMTNLYAQRIESTLKAEIEKFGNDFVLSGIGKRMRYYDCTIVNILGGINLFRLENHIFFLGFKAESWKSYEALVKLVLELVQKFKDVDITVYDWILEEGIKDFEDLAKSWGYKISDINLVKRIIAHEVEMQLVA